MLTAITTRPPIANTSLHAFAAAIAPKSLGSSTSGGKKSVVLTKATSSETWYTAASSKGARPTSNAGSSDAGKSLTKSASNVAPHLAAHPPHEVHSVRRSGEMLGELLVLLILQSLEAVSLLPIRQMSKLDHRYRHRV